MKSKFEQTGMPQKILILHDIRSAQNVGSLLRTADAAGIDQVYLSAITPHPIDRFGRPNTAVIKASLGAEQTLLWNPYADIDQLLDTLQAQGVMIIAIEQSSTAKHYTDIEVAYPVAFILGNEVEGIPESVLKKAVVAEIPMKGDKESLNVAVAGGIALFRMLKI